MELVEGSGSFFGVERCMNNRLQTIIHFTFRKGLKEKRPDPWIS
jgi:hypothetical protein